MHAPVARALPYDLPVTTPAAPPPPAPFDAGNALLSEQPAQLVTAVVQAPAGQRLALTVRTPSATVTVFLAAQDARAWAARLTADSGAMSVAGLVVANGTTLDGAGKQP
jgi:hypothetical protein